MVLKDIYKIEDKANHKSTSVNVLIDKSHNIFKGHFPDHPILPGVVILQILMDLIEKQLNRKVNLLQYKQVKFLNLVEPNLNNKLVFTFEIEEIESKYLIKNQTTFPDGTTVLKCNATFVDKLDL